MHGSSHLEITRRELLKIGALSAAATTVPLVARAKAPIAEPPGIRVRDYPVTLDKLIERLPT